ncbi:DHA1 family tetracycline resistance protein-like MFS transporter [Rhodoblastus acidophilus]|uniref:TCR/Tet family MFS transporter n=1 Tax=Rhodoblastus acidophilus TaxID=1074 RepID=UPI001615ACEB|nr:TCR/Tet family MFS transporter [Rhodoblastus acidophilus]MCW2282786.1 DHA1 family tetracycline resistance protein-like MFS transporter [Rhodoblastus acidophilus]MCW2331647.1 DHA1 family tetracycline resistance protein-like MFS transporter [Rhodoblastus acidophilus]
MQSYKPGKAAFIFIFITAALDVLALGIIVPVLPKLIVSFRDGDFSAASRWVGYFGIAWAMAQFMCQPVLGALSDRFGRRPVVLLSNIGLGVDYLVMALAPSLTWLFIGRLASGAAAASFSTAQAYIADITPADKRAAKFGLLGAVFGVGFTIGPALGGWLGGIDLRLPFWAAAGFSLANAVYGYFVLPESLAPENRTKKFVWRSASVFGALKFIRRDSALAAIVLAIFLSLLAHESLPSLFVLYTDYRYHWTPTETGLALAGVGIFQTLVAGGLVRHAVKRFGETPSAVAGLVFGVLGFVGFAVAPVGWAFLAAIPLIALWSLAAPAMQSMATRFVGVSEQGALQGAVSSLRGVSGMIGPITFTQLLAFEISKGHMPGMAYGLSALLCSFSFLVVVALARRGVMKDVTAAAP